MVRKKLKPLFKQYDKNTQQLSLEFEKSTKGDNRKLIIRRKSTNSEKYFLCKLDCKNTKIQDLVTLVCNKLKDIDLLE